MVWKKKKKLHIKESVLHYRDKNAFLGDKIVYSNYILIKKRPKNFIRHHERIFCFVF